MLGLRAWIGGGNFDNADRCGPACLNSNGNPWNVNGNYGLRVVSDNCIREAASKMQHQALRLNLTRSQPASPGPQGRKRHVSQSRKPLADGYKKKQ